MSEGSSNPIHGGHDDSHGGGHGHGSVKSGKEEKYVSTLSDEERIGLTTEEAEKRV